MRASTILGLLTALLAHIGIYSLLRPDDSLFTRGTVTFLVVLLLCYGTYWVLIDRRQKAPLLQKVAWTIAAFVALVCLHFIAGLAVIYLAQMLPSAVWDWADFRQFELLYRRSYIPLFLVAVVSGHVIKYVVEAWYGRRNTLPL
jgi:drug/metabolite transporter (DMT)-like permease